jgi:hypothetical protein
MELTRRDLFKGSVAIAASRAMSSVSTAAEGSLSSWNDGLAKKAFTDFVPTTTDHLSPRFVPKEERIATLDQDGALWVEHTIYLQVVFALDRVVALAPKHQTGSALDLHHTQNAAGEGILIRPPKLLLNNNFSGKPEDIYDADREYAYGPANGLPDTKVGTFSQALYDEAKAKGWSVISMKNDWKRIFAFDN